MFNLLFWRFAITSFAIPDIIPPTIGTVFRAIATTLPESSIAVDSRFLNFHSLKLPPYLPQGQNFSYFIWVFSFFKKLAKITELLT